jgi:dTDP-4-amino-4,6-dideoxygalactose transaminase
LRGISLDKNVQTILFKLVKEKFEEQYKQQNFGPSHYKKINDINERLNRLQDLYIDGKMDAIDYQKAKVRNETILNELKSKEKQQFNKKEILDTYKNGLNKLESIDNLFVNSDINQKRKLIVSIFPKKFQFEKNEVRTADINPILLKIANINKGLLRNKKWDKSKKDDLACDDCNRHIVIPLRMTLSSHL